MRAPNQATFFEWMVMLTEAFRRMSGKTQVFSQTAGVRDRMIHTMEMYSIAVAIAEEFFLNIEVVRAIAIAHDIGHVPFGHMGERFLKEVSGRDIGHNRLSLIMLDIEGISCPEEVKEGIYLHSGHPAEDSVLLPEYLAVRFADRLAFTLSDIEDMLMLGVLKEKDLPDFVTDLGENRMNRLAHCLYSMGEETRENNKRLSFKESQVAINFRKTITWLFQEIYPKQSLKIPMVVIERGYRAIQKREEFKDFDHPMIFALMTEDEIFQIAKGNLSGRTKDKVYFSLQKGRIY